MNTTRSALRLSLLAVMAAAACRGPLPVTYFEETPPGSGTWTVIPVEPAWVKTPPRRQDHIAFVVDNQSDLRDIARTNLDDWAARQVAMRVEVALRTIVPSPAAAAAASSASSSLRLVHCACRDEVLTRDERVVGSRLVTVWGLYEIPMEKALAPVAEPHRSAARAALEKL